MAGEYARELEVVREGRRQFPQYTDLIYAEIRALVALEREKEALAILDDHLSSLVPGQGPVSYLDLAAQEFQAHGYPQEADSLWARLLRWHSAQPPEVLDTPQSRREVVRTLLHLGREVEAEPLAEALTDAESGDLDAWGMLGAVKARLGKSDAAEEVLIRLENWSDQYSLGQNTLWRARIEADLGHPEKAVALLGLAGEEGWRIRDQPHRDPFLRALRGHPDFQQFLEPKG
jgi:hypothetical protein